MIDEIPPLTLEVSARSAGFRKRLWYIYFSFNIQILLKFVSTHLSSI